MFSIDTDRVFLSGHGVGGDAVYDIGLAHPEHWAGVIGPFGKNRPICRSLRYQRAHPITDLL